MGKDIASVRNNVLVSRQNSISIERQTHFFPLPCHIYYLVFVCITGCRCYCAFVFSFSQMLNDIRCFIYFPILSKIFVSLFFFFYVKKKHFPRPSSSSSTSLQQIPQKKNPMAADSYVLPCLSLFLSFILHSVKLSKKKINILTLSGCDGFVCCIDVYSPDRHEVNALL